MAHQTNVARILDKQKIPYQLQEISVKDEHLDAVKVSEIIGVSPEELYKTLVTITDKKEIVVACIPAHHHLDLKKLAKLSGHKKLTMLPMKDLQAYTGYIRGGCSPIGMKKSYPTFIEADALNHENIFVSAGKRGFQVSLSPQALLQLISGKAETISTQES